MPIELLPGHTPADIWKLADALAKTFRWSSDEGAGVFWVKAHARLERLAREAAAVDLG